MDDLQSVALWRRVLRPSVLAALLSPVLLLVDIALITVFILQQNWRAVILTSAMFFGGAQAIFWFSRAKTIFNTHQQVRSSLATGETEAVHDDPPSYEEVIKTEAPPPPYYTVVSETQSPSTSSGSHWEDPKTKAKNHMQHPSQKEVLRDVPSVREESQEQTGSRSALYAVTSPFIHEIMNDESSQRSSSSTGEDPRACVRVPRDFVHQDPVEAIRTPIIRETNGFTAPTHLPTTDRHASIASVR